MFMRGPARNSTSSRLTPSMSSTNGGQHEFEFYAFKKNPEPVKNNANNSVPNPPHPPTPERPSQPPIFDDDTIFDLDRLIQLFAMCDQDNDDYVTRADFVRVSHEIGGLPPSLVCQLDRVLPASNPNLRVSLHELVTMARNFTASTSTPSSSSVMMPLQPNNSNNGSSPVKLKRYEQQQTAPPTPNTTPDHRQQFADLQSSSKWQQTSSCSPTPLPPPTQRNNQKAEMPEVMTNSMSSNQSVIARLQREKESLEGKLAAILHQHRQYGGMDDQIGNLQALIAKYHQQIFVALELQKGQQKRSAPPPVAPKPPPRRSLPVIQQQQQQQQQVQNNNNNNFQQPQPQVASMPRLVSVQHCTPPCGVPGNFGLEQIDEMSQPESGDETNNNNNQQMGHDSYSSESSTSSSEGEQPDEDDRNRRRSRHSRHHPHRQSCRQQSLPQLVPPQPIVMVQQPVEPQQPPPGFIDIETVDSAFQQQEQLVSHLKQQLIACMSDRDRYKKLAQDFYRRVQFQKNGSSDLPSSPTTPMMENNSNTNTGTQQLPSTPSSSRMAEVRQLTRLSSVSPMLNGDTSTPNVTAAELSANHGALSTPVAEHLVEETEHAAVIQELIQSLASSGCRIPPEKLAEFAAELECRSSKADRLRAAADLLASSLSKQRQHAANLANALARSEENQSAIRMALDCALQKADAFQALLKLSESEQLLLLAHCRAIGVVSSQDDQSNQFEPDQQTVLLGQAVSARRQAELEAQRLLSRLDNSCGILGHNSGASSAVGGELLLSSNNSNSSPRATGTCSSTGTTSSRTTDPLSQPEEGASSSGVGSTSSTWTSMDEQRLREYAAQLDRDVQAMQMTLNDPVLESAAAVAAVHCSSNGVVSSSNQHLINASLLDSPLPLSSVGTNGSGSTKDSLFGQHQQQIETAVLIQELATLKEQRAESRTQCFILEREKRGLEAELRVRDQQATVLRVQLDQTRLELEETTNRVRKLEEIVHQNGGDSRGEAGANFAGAQSELSEALLREKRLRARIQELVDTLEMVGRSAEKQVFDGGVDLVSELRKANVTLSESYERARKKQEQRIKKLETQLGAVTSRYETKISLLKKQVALLEETTNIGGQMTIDGPSYAPEAHL